MERNIGQTFPLLLLVALALALVGCGSSGGGAATGATKASSTGSSTVARDFLVPGEGPEQLAAAGEEAPASEREIVSRVVEENSRARAGKNYSKQCATLARETITRLELAVRGQGFGKGCVNSLRGAALEVPASVLANTMSGPIGALRLVKPSEGYALYHGNNGHDYYVQVVPEGKKWKVAMLVPKRIGAKAAQEEQRELEEALKE
jgi:hypothetical protein